MHMNMEISECIISCLTTLHIILYIHLFIYVFIFWQTLKFVRHIVNGEVETITSLKSTGKFSGVILTLCTNSEVIKLLIPLPRMGSFIQLCN